jgi:adenylate kinase family enzyme
LEASWPGSSAGGKSTLARPLTGRCDLPFIEVDRLLWQPGWQLTPEPDYSRRHAEIIAQDRFTQHLGLPDDLAASINHTNAGVFQ